VRLKKKKFYKRTELVYTRCREIHCKERCDNARVTAPPLTVGTAFRLYIHIYSHKLQLQKQEIKKTKEKDTQRVKKNNVSNAY